jgi:hypothetical protein
MNRSGRQAMNASHRQVKRLLRIPRLAGLLLAREALARTVNRVCVGDIPISGIEARAVNCWTVKVLKDNEPFFDASSCHGFVIRGSAWDSVASQYSGDLGIHIARLKKCKIEFIHYWDIHRIRAPGVASYFMIRLTRIPYIIAIGKQGAYLAQKKLFHLKTIEEADRDMLLEYLVSQYAFSRDSFHVDDLLTRKYSAYWFGHPDANSIRQKTEYTLDSLCATGELTKNPYQQYTVQPLAMSTVAKTRNADLRHRASMRVELLSIAIGFAVMLTAAIEAGLIRMPCFLSIGGDDRIRAEKECLINKHIGPILRREF